MACALTSGYTYIGCKGGLSGLDEVLWSEFANVTVTTVVANVITVITMTGATKYRKYVLDKDMGMDSSDMTFTSASGTLSSLHKVDFTIKGITTAMQAELKLAMQNVLSVIVKRRDGTYWMYGRTKGMDIMTTTAGSAKEATGFTGHNISLQGIEPDFAIEVTGSIMAAITA